MFYLSFTKFFRKPTYNINADDIPLNNADNFLTAVLHPSHFEIIK